MATPNYAMYDKILEIIESFKHLNNIKPSLGFTEWELTFELEFNRSLHKFGKSLSIMVAPTDVTYLIAWGPDMEHDMIYGKIPEDALGPNIRSLLVWLNR